MLSTSHVHYDAFGSLQHRHADLRSLSCVLWSAYAVTTIKLLTAKFLERFFFIGFLSPEFAMVMFHSFCHYSKTIHQ